MLPLKWGKVEYGGATRSRQAPRMPRGSTRGGGEVRVPRYPHPASRREGPALPAREVPRPAGRRPRRHQGPGALPLRLSHGRVRADRDPDAAGPDVVQGGPRLPARLPRRRHDEAPDRQGRLTIRRCASTPGSPATVPSSAPAAEVEVWDSAAWASYLEASEQAFAEQSEEVVPASSDSLTSEPMTTRTCDPASSRCRPGRLPRPGPPGETTRQRMGTRPQVPADTPQLSTKPRTTHTRTRPREHRHDTRTRAATSARPARPGRGAARAGAHRARFGLRRQDPRHRRPRGGHPRALPAGAGRRDRPRPTGPRPRRAAARAYADRLASVHAVYDEFAAVVESSS